MRRQETQWLLQEKYNGQESQAFFADCDRLEAGEPLGYVIGHVPFLNCTINLDSKPLIPRPETEYWVEQAITAISHRCDLWKPIGRTYGEQSDVKVLDLCAGSGCVGVAVATAVAGAEVTFAEIDASHHATIHKNYHENMVEKKLPITRDRKLVYGGDLFAEIPKGTQYDFILSNPPYINPALDRTEATVTNYEPHQALYGGEDGMELLSRIIANAPAFLTPGGELWLEHEPEQTPALQARANKHGFTCHTQLDQYQRERYSQLVLQ